MRTEVVQVAETPEDLTALPTGSLILTATHRLFQMDVIEAGRSDSGKRYWIEPGTLQPFPPQGLEHWFPALILPIRGMD